MWTRWYSAHNSDHIKLVKSIKPVLACALAIIGIVSAGRAKAAYHADFFDRSRRPSITFDKGKTTWTLRNQGVERVVHYDAKAGALQTIALRDLHTRHVLQAASNGEGEITFASPLLQTPILLTGAKTTFIRPDENWTKPDFDAKTWQAEPPAGSPSGLPIKSEQFKKDQKGQQGGNGKQNGQSVWYRVTLPEDRLKPGHAYALYLSEGIAGEAEVYADGVLLQKFPDSLSRPGRPEQIDLPTSCHVIAMKFISGELPRNVYTVEVGSSPPALQLAGNWQYMHHTINAGEENSQILTIRLSGLKRYEGFELDVSYQIYAGEEPTISKWFTFVSHRKSRFLMETVTYDRWLLPASWAKSQANTQQEKTNPSATFVQADALTGDVLMTSQLAIPAIALLSKDYQSAAPNAELNIALKPELPQQTPRSLTAFWHGSLGTGQFLHQLYVGQYVTTGSPPAIPIAYDTRFTYRDNIDAATCEKIIPLASAMGAQAFVLDDGWQSNLTPDTGRYGDWRTDKIKFPKGILPISTLVRESHMQFGLWIDAVQTDSRSEAAVQHPDWLTKALPVLGGEEDVSDRMCFTGAWAQQFTQSILSLSREQGLTYLKARFRPSDGCMATGHDHPVGHSLGREQDAWNTFGETLKSAHPNFAIVDDALPELYWLGQPFTSPALKHVMGWLNATDILLPPAEDAYMNPPYLVTAEAFCHLPTEERPTPDQLQFLWSYVAGSYPNFEIQGDLQAMTAEERDAAHKWIDWTLENQEWLAFAQPLSLTPPRERAETERSLSSEQTVDKAVHGVLHLRNALKGRYGYLCVWNQSNAPTTITPTFNPNDYFVRIKSGSVEFINVSTERPAPFTQRNGDYSLGPITLPAYGWAIYEINQTGSPRKAFELKPSKDTKPLSTPTLP